eukprot:CAMPEP_0183342192 /NCGR_PEP_ID=MMETSP0164_2-20130417/8349_1 /TAXON_ID=221442 /ORGANISM="Coccolithus pelagicus ssp braarudi, Strain PLY182g" /LENGTH=68 /DNA_ID=CAMNT_0025512705 /DNA_START=461 /DNA_END=665 /DNA_ORIENTATION=+
MRRKLAPTPRHWQGWLWRWSWDAQEVSALKGVAKLLVYKAGQSDGSATSTCGTQEAEVSHWQTEHTLR